MGCRNCDLLIFTAEMLFLPQALRKFSKPDLCAIVSGCSVPLSEVLNPLLLLKIPFWRQYSLLFFPQSNPFLLGSLPLSAACQGYAAGKSSVFGCFPAVWPAAKSNCSSSTRLSCCPVSALHLISFILLEISLQRNPIQDSNTENPRGNSSRF